MRKLSGQSLSNYLKELRLGLGLTQGQIASQLKVSTVFICHIENGKVKPPLDFLVKYFKAAKKVNKDLPRKEFTKQVVNYLQTGLNEKIEYFEKSLN